MGTVAAATPEAARSAADDDEDDMEDFCPFAYLEGEGGSDMDISDDEGDGHALLPPPVPAQGPARSWEDRVTEMWNTFVGTKKGSKSTLDPDETHFVPWDDVNQEVQVAGRPVFTLKLGMKKRIRSERNNSNPVTELEAFEKLFSESMQKNMREHCDADQCSGDSYADG